MDYFKSFGIDIAKSQPHEEAVYSIALLYNLLNARIEEYLGPFGLSAAKFNVLMTVEHQRDGRGISQVDISKHLIVSPANMTKLLDKLEDEALVTRSALEGDRRVKIVRTTAKGEKLLDQVWPGYLKILHELGSKMQAGKQSQTAKLLREWIVRLADERAGHV
ncbi:MAG: MarR family transcriptional regulator [Candidatus Omnitrophota bacterium]|nr:MarR family transcriptional regulator [Candidatus Omnitrophota bacterium]MDZ4241252.1 MarR family transcriptional regulator [Candidatus Omnitrophota bacterium]